MTAASLGPLSEGLSCVGTTQTSVGSTLRLLGACRPRAKGDSTRETHAKCTRRCKPPATALGPVGRRQRRVLGAFRQFMGVARLAVTAVRRCRGGPREQGRKLLGVGLLRRARTTQPAIVVRHSAGRHRRQADACLAAASCQPKLLCSTTRTESPCCPPVDTPAC